MKTFTAISCSRIAAALLTFIAFYTFEGKGRELSPVSKLLYSQELVDGDIPVCVKMLINDTINFNALIDTGASVELVIDSEYRGLGSETEGTVNINEGTLSATTALLKSSKFGKLGILEPTAVFVDLNSSMQYIVSRPHAIVGTKMLAQTSVKFDYDDGRLEIFKGSVSPSADMKTLALSIMPNGAARIETELDGESINLTIDSGSTGAIRIPRSTFEKWTESGRLKLDERSGSVATLTGKSSTLSGTIQSGELMGIPLKGIEVLSDEDTHSFCLIGLAFLRRFNFIIDFDQMVFHYTPRQLIADTPPIDVLVGGRLVYGEAGCRIEKLKPGGGCA